MKLPLVILIALILLNSCQEKNGATLSLNQNSSFPFIKDTSDCFPVYKKSSSLSKADYRVLYIGPPKDTIISNYYMLHWVPPPPPPTGVKVDDYFPQNDTFVNPLKGYYLDWLDQRDFENWELSKIEIKIDTSSKIKRPNSYFSYSEPCTKAYPVFLKNNEHDTIYIGYGDYIPLILEAKDSSNVWVPIEERRIYRCGVGVGSIILPPKEIILTSCAIHKGNYNTDLRLKIGLNYSQIFKGSINYLQFKSKYERN